MISLLKKLLLRTPYQIVNASRRRGLSPLTDIRDLLGEKTTPMLFDVGANEGQTATTFRAAFPQAIIHSFEPMRETFGTLRRRLAADKNSFCHQLAFGAAPTQTTVYPQSESQFNSLVPALNTAGGSNGEVVQVVTVDTFCREGGIEKIDLLKTDTEGFDLEVLRGATHLLKEKRIRLIFSEAGIRCGDTRHTPLAELITFLAPHGYSLFGLYDFPLKGSSVEAEFCNALFRVDPATPNP